MKYSAIMKMPPHVNQLDFYTQAKKKAISIESRYEGVFFCLSWKDSPRWRAQCGKGRDPQILGTYPLTEVGEKMAAKTYADYLKKEDILYEALLPPAPKKQKGK